MIVEDTGSSSRTYTDTSVTPRTRYVYRVKAWNAQGLSNWSSYANAETAEDSPTAEAPSKGGGTELGKPLNGEALPTGESEPPLTAAVMSKPLHFIGTKTFEVSFAFTEPVSVDRYWTPRLAFEVANGYLRVGWPTPLGEVGPEWKFNVTPDGSGPVSIRMIGDRKCYKRGAICTADGTELSGDLNIVIPKYEGDSVYLTFDDGPDPDNTPELLDVLARHGAKATFFIHGANVVAYPDLVDRIVAEGHTLANHTWDDRTVAGTTLEQFNDTVLTTQKSMGRHATPCLRVPKFGIDRFTYRRARDLGLMLVGFTANPKDWHRPGASVIADRIVAGTVPGAIIVLHDHSHSGAQTVEAVDLALTQLQDRQLSFEPLCTPFPNSPAAGVPTVSGRALVGETLIASTSGIDDANGLQDAAFSYQWLAEGTEIEGATGAEYTLSDAEAGQRVGVRVAFTDDAGYLESASSETTRPVGGLLYAGEQADMVPAASGYSVFGDLGGALTPSGFNVGGTPHGVQFLIHLNGGLWLGTDRELPADFTLRVGDSAYRGSRSMVPRAGTVGRYWWPAPRPDWLGGRPVEVGLVLHPGAPLGHRRPAPVTGYFTDVPAEHDGIRGFSFRVYFNEGVAVTADALRDHVLAVSGGAVSGVEPVGSEGRIWEVAITPESRRAVTVGIAAGLDCGLPEAVCTADGRGLFSRLELAVVGPPSVPALIWSATMTVGEAAHANGHSSDAGGTGRLSDASFELDGVAYALQEIMAWEWLYIGVDNPLPAGLTLEVDGSRFPLSEAETMSYAYGTLYLWPDAEEMWPRGSTVRLALTRAE